MTDTLKRAAELLRHAALFERPLRTMPGVKYAYEEYYALAAKLEAAAQSTVGTAGLHDWTRRQSPDHIQGVDRMSAYTGGPWRVRKYPGRGTNIEWGNDDEVERPICHLRWTDGMRPEVESRVAADARLIAAAPDLLAALQDMLDGFDTRAHTDAAYQRHIADRARTVLAKAAS